MPGRAYSTGSSKVIRFFPTELTRINMLYMVVVFPEPVGPVTKIMPWGLLMMAFIFSRFTGLKPRSSKVYKAAARSRTLKTIFSPIIEGMEEMRKSTSRPSTIRRVRPSWGSLRSEMSRLAIIFSREATAAMDFWGSSKTSKSSPSMRNRTLT